MSLVTTATALPALSVSAMSEEARAYAREASAANTRRAYRAAWQDFTTWCETEGRSPLPAAPETVGTFLAARAATHKVSSLGTRLAAIKHAHRLKGFHLDTTDRAIRETFKGIRNKHGTAPQKKSAAETSVLQVMLRELARGDGLRSLRDRALLLVGFAAALRRSELVALDVEDLRFVPEGLVLTLRKSKTDQERKGTEIAIPFGSSDRTCPVTTMRNWLTAARIEAGPAFVSVNRHGRPSQNRLSDRDVALVVKRAAEAAGYKPKDYAGHSLRSGFITAAAKAGVPEAHIQNQSRHKSLPVLRGYIRRGSLFMDNAAAKVGL